MSHFGFSYLFVLGQTLCVAQSFAAVVHLQHQWFVVAVGAAVRAAGHRQVVHRTETVKTGVTADLVDSTTQDHLMFALRGEMTNDQFRISESAENLSADIFIIKVIYHNWKINLQ